MTAMRQEHPLQGIEYAPLPPRQQSGVGIASFCIAVAAVAILVAVFSAIKGRSASDMMAYKLLGLAFILPALGTVLGIVSMFQRRRYRGLPIAGLAINLLLGLFVLLITVPSLLHELSR
jgi:cytochrome bd-type quinol oxidase subunit 2